MTEQVSNSDVFSNHASQAEGAEASARQMDTATKINSETPVAPPASVADHIFNKIDNESVVEAKEQDAPADEVVKKFAEKYDTIEDLENGYINLNKKIGGFSGAPEKYSFEKVNTDANGLEFNSEDEGLKGFMTFAQESNMSQKIFDGCLYAFRSHVQARIDEANKDYKLLGDEADKKLAELNSFAKNNLAEEGYSRYKRFANSSIKEADLLLLLDDFRNASKPVEGPTTFANPSSPSPTQTIKSLKMEIQSNKDKYFDSNDSTFRDRINNEMTRAHDMLERKQPRT